MWIQKHKRTLVRLWLIVLVIDVILILIQAGGALLSFVERTGSGPIAEMFPQTIDGTNGESGQVMASIPEPFRAIINQLDINHHGNFATWFNAFNFFLAGLSAFVVVIALEKEKLFLRLCWLAIALALILLAAEEVVSVKYFLDSIFSSSQQLSHGSFSWKKGLVTFLFYTLPLLAGAIAFVVLTFYTFREFRFVRKLALLGVLCWIVSFFMEEMVHFLPHYLQRTEMFLEESLELAGALLFIFGFVEFGLLKNENVSNQIS